MTSVIFDPDARAEFLSAVQHYENCVLHAPFRRCLLQKFPYAIIYSIEPDHIHIIAVAHTKRKPGYWLIRHKDTQQNALE